MACRLPIAGAATLLLAACVAVPPGPRAPADAGRRGATPRPTATGPATAGPAKARPAASAAPGGASPRGLLGAALRRPAGATVPLAGVVRVDASYMVAAGAGNVLSRNGGQIVAAGGLNLIGADGGSLIGADGGSLIGADGGSLVGADGGSLIGADGGSLIGADGGSLIGADGGSLIGADGGSLIGADGGSLVGADGGTLVAAGAGNMVAPGGVAAGARASADASGNLLPAGAGGPAGYHLAQAATTAPGSASPAGSASPPGASPTALAVGAQLPAAGMLLSVVRLRDHAYLPLGVDAQGQPVYTVYSNARGAYEVWIPASERGNVAIVTGVPGQADYRLTLNRVAAPGDASELAVDEVSALSARYLRLSMTSRLAAAMQHPDLAIGLLTYERAFTGAPEAAGDQAPVGSPFWRVVRVIGQIAAIAREAGFTDDSPEEAWLEAAQRCVDGALGRIPLPMLVTRAADLRYTDGVVEGKPVLQAFDESTSIAHEAAARLLRTRPDFFAQAFLEGTINAPVPGIGVLPPIGDWTGRIRKPGDVGEYMLIEYFGAPRLGVVTPLRRLYATFYEALGETGPAIEAKAATMVSTGRAAAYTILTTLARELQGEQVATDGTLVAPNAEFEAELRAICADVAARHRAP